MRTLPVEIPDVSSSSDLCQVSIRLDRPRGTGRGPVGVTFGLDVIAVGGLQEKSHTVAPTISADQETELRVLLPPTAPGGTGARRTMRMSTIPAPDVFSAGLMLGQGVEIHYGDTETTTISGVPGPEGVPRPYGTVVIDDIDSSRIAARFEIRFELPYRRTPTGPEAGTGYRDETAQITFAGEFSGTFETLARFRGLRDGINYGDPGGAQ